MPTDAPAKKAAKGRSRKAAPPPEDAPVPDAPAAKAPRKKAAPKGEGAAAKPPVERTRVVIPMKVYEARKDEVKAPVKARGLKWTFLGEGKGLYKKEGVNVFTQFMDDGVHYSVWGDAKEEVAGLLAEWRALLGDDVFQQATTAGEAATKAEEAQKESEALRLWRLQEPQRRPGEPDFFFKKRVEEWQAKRPA